MLSLPDPLRFVALAPAENRARLDLCPLGIPAEFLDAAAYPAVVERYLTANRRAFPPPLELPGWVLVDLFLMPGAIGMIMDAEDIVAAYVAVPTVHPGEVMGVSLFCHRPGRRLGETVKRLTLAMLGARAQVGITQWGKAAIATHSRIGAMRVLGPAPQAHGAGGSFRYRIDLAGGAPRGESAVLALAEGETVAREAMLGGVIWVVGVDAGGVRLVRGGGGRTP